MLIETLAALGADGFGRLSVNGDWLVSASLLAETCRLTGDRASAGSLYPLLLPYAERNANGEGELSLGAVSRYLGLLAAALVNTNDAIRHFEHALELNSRMEALPWLAHTQLDYGDTLLVQGGAGDRARAQELRSAALAGFRELGMKPHAARPASTRPS